MESELEQERASRAEDVRQLQEAKDDVWLHQQEIGELQERDALLKGGDLESSEALKPLWQNMATLFQTLQQVGTQFRRLEEDSEQLMSLGEKVEELNTDNAKKQAKLDSLVRRPVFDQPVDGSASRIEAAALLAQIAKKPTLESALRAMELLLPDRLVILQSAYASARESAILAVCQRRRIFYIVLELNTGRL